MAEFRLETPRLVLREWREADVAALHAICADPRVMEFLGPALTLAEVAAAIARQRQLQADLGRCFWAIERRDRSGVIGFCGVKPGPDGTPVAGREEIGWRLAHAAWGQGHAREAAQAVLAWAFAHLPDQAIWAITVRANTRSWGLMERLGMRRVPEGDFDHPGVADGSPLKPHITYRLTRKQWSSR